RFRSARSCPFRCRGGPLMLQSRASLCCALVLGLSSLSVLVVATAPGWPQDKGKGSVKGGQDLHTLGLKYRLAWEQLRKARTDLVQAQAERRILQLELDVLGTREKSIVAQPIFEDRVEEIIAPDKLLGTLQGRVAYLEEQLDSFQGKGKDDPNFQRLTKE